MTRADMHPVHLPPDRTQDAIDALGMIREYLTLHQSLQQVRVRVEDGTPAPLILPREAVELLATMLAHLGAGRSVSVVPHNAELTTQQAADILNVSRPFLVGLIDAGELACRKVGTHRRVSASDLFEYMRTDDQRRRERADELTALSRELGLS